ncbi:MAG: hypothetical protein ACREGC_03660 [Minisyncoccia bacterium]
MANKNHILIIYESRKDSIITDLFTFGSLTAAVGMGVLLNSTALQWIAGLSWAAFVLGAGARKINNFKRSYTIAEARAYLDKIEKEGFNQ